MKILLAVDGSSCSEKAVQDVIRQYARKDTEVRVVHVDEWPKNLPMSSAFARGPHAAADVEAEHEERRRQAAALIDGVKTRLTHAGFQATGVVLRGDARHAILDEAATWPADLIVLGSHGLTGINRILLGSVSDSVSRHAPCSVQIVRNAAALLPA